MCGEVSFILIAGSAFLLVISRHKSDSFLTHNLAVKQQVTASYSTAF